MPSLYFSDFSSDLAKARAWLDEYQRGAQTTERAIVESVISTREAIAQSRDLLDRVGSRLDGK